MLPWLAFRCVSGHASLLLRYLPLPPQRPLLLFPPSPSPMPASKSFAQALSNSCVIPVAQLPTPCLKGDDLSIKISQDEYLMGVADCQKVLHGRYMLSKGATPICMQDLRNRIVLKWRTKDSWQMVSLGKGYYEFVFSSMNDLQTVRSIGSWNLDPSVFRLFAWTPDFNPYSIRLTSVQVWIRLHGLSREYWRPKILFEITGAIRVPLALDDPTMKRTLCHFARILVDVDLNTDLRDRLLVERDGFAFFVNVEYEKLPPFFPYCQVIGHNMRNYKHSRLTRVPRSAGVHPQIYVPKPAPDKLAKYKN